MASGIQGKFTFFVLEAATTKVNHFDTTLGGVSQENVLKAWH
jgi:hypothetical protein